MDSELTDLRGYVPLTKEADIVRAHLIAGALEAAAIPCHVEQDDLADEFSMFQKLLGAPRVRVLVPADRLDEARAVFLAMSQPLPVVEEDPELAAFGERVRRRNRRIVLVLVLAMSTPLLYLVVRGALRALGLA